MFVHRKVEYYIGFCQGLFEVNIPSLKFFKTYKLGENTDKNIEKAHEKAITKINEIHDLQRSSSKL